MTAGIAASNSFVRDLTLCIGSALFVQLATSHDAKAQSTELVRFPPAVASTYATPVGSMPTGEYCMCCGHRDPVTGDEFAAVGVENGIFIAHVPTPRSSTDNLQGATFDTWFFEEAPQSRWRGVASFRNLIYSLQPFHAGIRRFRVDANATGASRVVDLGHSNKSQLSAGFQRITVDSVHGHLYVCGQDRNLGRNALCIYDIYDELTDTVIDPPQLLAVWAPRGTVVDTFVTEDRIYVAHQPANDPRWWQILDRNAVPAASVLPYSWAPPYGEWRNSVPGGAQLSHDGYVSPDGNTWYTTTEGFGFMTARDISNLPPLSVAGTMFREPPVIGSYDSTTPVPMHAMEGVGLTGYISHWSLGMTVIDLAVTPGGLGLDYPVIASHQTGTTGSLEIGDGAWDCDPHQDSGLVFISDSEEGLIVVRLDQAHLNRYGEGLPNSLGVPRIVNEHGAPRIGRPLVLTGEGHEPGGGAVFTLGFAEHPSYLIGNTLNILGIDVYVDTAGLEAFFYFTGPEGRFDHTLPVPNAPSLVGAKLFSQSVELRPSGGFASSRGTWFGFTN